MVATSLRIALRKVKRQMDFFKDTVYKSTSPIGCTRTVHMEKSKSEMMNMPGAAAPGKLPGKLQSSTGQQQQ